MVPNFFEMSTPKLTKLADKIHFGTKIQPEYTVNLTKVKRTITDYLQTMHHPLSELKTFEDDLVKLVRNVTFQETSTNHSSTT
jgi:hypothetical protein